jgi:hypothetical protein
MLASYFLPGSALHLCFAIISINNNPKLRRFEFIVGKNSFKIENKFYTTNICGVELIYNLLKYMFI